LNDANSFVYSMNRMKWLDYSTILIVNEEGIEKILNIDNNFEEVSFNARPMFRELYYQ
jgi:hypothetical protein